MADFCKQCSIELFGEDFGDHKGHCKEGMMVAVICEGCGFVHVDHEGKCLTTDCLRKHGAENAGGKNEKSDQSDNQS